MAEENYSTYQWEKADPRKIICNPTIENKIVTVTANISHDNIFALIAGTYQVTVEGQYKIEEPEHSEDNGQGSEVKYIIAEKPFEVLCTAEIKANPKLCTRNDGNHTVELTLTGIANTEYGSYDHTVTGTKNDFKIQPGENIPNKYLYILRTPELITNLFIDGRSADNTYVKGSALPINEIQNISTIDFNDIKINDVQHDIFYKLNSIGGENIVTNKLSVPELTVVDLPEKEDEQIIICKSKSKNKGVTFKTKDPDISRKHFGYIIDIKGYRSAGYNSVWINRKTLDKIFPGMPADIMSNTDMFECTDSFNFHELT